MDRLIKKVETISCKEDFIEFTQMLLSDFNTNPVEWQNKTLESYLTAMGSWTEDMEGYYENNNLQLPKNIEWKVFATILLAAKVYE